MLKALYFSYFPKKTVQKTAEVVRGRLYEKVYLIKL